MLESFAGSVIRRWIADKIIPENKAAIYQYGFVVGLQTMLEFLLIVATSLFLGLFYPCVIMTCVFIPIRIYGGGFHASTALRCSVATWLMHVVAFLYVKYVPARLEVQVGILFVSLILILWKAPVEAENKPLTPAERTKYRKKTIIFWLIIFGIYAILTLAGCSDTAYYETVGLGMFVFVMAAGILKNYMMEVKKNEISGSDL